MLLPNPSHAIAEALPEPSYTASFRRLPPPVSSIGPHRRLPRAALLPAHGRDEQAVLPRDPQPLAGQAHTRLRLLAEARAPSRWRSRPLRLAAPHAALTTGCRCVSIVHGRGSASPAAPTGI
eukprot:6182325-Pleurochrysis_carterae.AAC.7